MKKFISLLLCMALTASCATISAYAQPEAEEIGFAVASDLHANLPQSELTKTNDNPIFWYANRRASMDNESGFIIDSFLEQCAADEKISFVLISGDLADNGRRVPEEHLLVAEKLRKFEKTSGKQVYVISGNHDLGNNCETGKEEFCDIYSEFGYDMALTSREADCSYTANLGNNYRLIALDSTNYDKSTSDGITYDKLLWVKQQTENAKQDGRHPILMMHHNLLEHLPMQSIISSDFIIRNHLAVAEQFANQGIKLVFSGHEHCSDATSYTSSLGNVITDFATTALSMYPLSYRVFSLTEDTISYSSKKIEKINTDALTEAVSGYTPEMLDAMNEDLDAYAKGFLKTGIQYRLALSLTAEKLGIEPDAIYYNLVMNAVNTLTDLLSMPLYGENSLSEKAKNYGITLPESTCVNSWDTATEFVAAHYAGSESYEIDSPELTLLLRCVALILREEFSPADNNLCLIAADAIREHLGVGAASAEATRRFFGGITPTEYLLAAILSPVLYSFANDSDSTDDNFGSIAGYGTVTPESNIKNIQKNLSALLSKIIASIKMILGCLGRIAKAA